MTSRATPLDRVLAAARAFDGVCQADFRGKTVDGGPPIGDVGACLREAEDELGLTFECIGKRNQRNVYRLVGESDAGRRIDTTTSRRPPDGSQPGRASVGASPSVGAGQLFPPPSRPHWQGEGS
jgi:hypothetical protein